MASEFFHQRLPIIIDTFSTRDNCHPDRCWTAPRYRSVPRDTCASTSRPVHAEGGRGPRRPCRRLGRRCQVRPGEPELHAGGQRGVEVEVVVMGSGGGGPVDLREHGRHLLEGRRRRRQEAQLGALLVESPVGDKAMQTDTQTLSLTFAVVRFGSRHANATSGSSETSVSGQRDRGGGDVGVVIEGPGLVASLTRTKLLVSE